MNEDRFDYKALAAAMEKKGIMDKSFRNMTKEEMVFLIKTIIYGAASSDVPF